MKTNVAETSVQAYHDHINSGGAEGQAERVVFALSCIKGGATRKELAVFMGEDPGSVGGRANQLVKDKRLIEPTKRKCSVSGKEVKLLELPCKTLGQVHENLQGKKEACEVRYWVARYKSKKTTRKDLQRIIAKRGEEFRQAINKELGLA